MTHLKDSQVHDSNEHCKHKIRVSLNASAFYNLSNSIERKNRRTDNGPKREISNILQK